MAYGGFKDLARRTVSDKILREKTFNIAKNPKYDGYQRWVCFYLLQIFDKKSAGNGVNMHANNKRHLDLATTHQLAEELCKTIILRKNSLFKI